MFVKLGNVHFSEILQKSGWNRYSKGTPAYAGENTVRDTARSEERMIVIKSFEGLK